MSEAARIITEQVRVRLRHEGVDLAVDGALADRYVRDEVQRYSELALGGAHPLIANEGQTTREAVAALTGYGVLQPLLDDPSIEEIWINAPTRVLHTGIVQVDALRDEWPQMSDATVIA